MVKAQKYLEENYPTEESRFTTVLNLPNIELEKHLDVSNFPAITHLMCANNQITSLDLGENDTFGKIYLENNKITANLDVFSHLTRLYEINLENNDFVGSLKCFENCKWLYHLSIRNNEKITEGLEYLPNKLERIHCEGTIFYDILKPYDFDIMAWKLVNHPNKVIDNPKLIVEKIDEKIREVKADLNIYESHHANTEKEKISRLKSKLKILENHKEKAIRANQSLEQFEVFSNGIVEKIVEENKELKSEVEKLEKQIEELKLVAKVEIPPK